MSVSLIAPLPLDEAARLEALRPYQLLNTMQDETFAELVRLIAKLFRVPISIIALVEEEVVRFELNHGLPAGLDLVERGQTLCSVALLESGVTVFDDLHAQPCSLIDPALVQQLQLGFYAGHTLRTPAGQPIGVLCVIDHRPRRFSAADTELLTRFAALVMSLLDLRVALAQRPRWNQDLWADVYARIEVSVARLDALAAVAAPGEAPTGLVHEQMLRVIDVLHEHVGAAQGL
ncbi:GAF domain-containing protein [Hymenobacter sp. 15J16-1T3B]|uniref:GAF domain-containing protein n=1 Tax=Hymenobacter sp. 15J16-1T3B TaxID=2886941 RepID=UPI001D125FC4|nr:GAF domain-containing protein [Hymenobacter sp. 15J16-1T3B]MCC3157184.1 GAF domain-containing protein [Hymenobacter sp. 15J16-1T3B]